jgi:hypothetical protein
MKKLIQFIEALKRLEMKKDNKLRQEQIDENLMNLYKGELVKRKLIQEGTFEDFMNSFNKQNPEWNKQTDTTKENSDGA